MEKMEMGMEKAIETLLVPTMALVAKINSENGITPDEASVLLLHLNLIEGLRDELEAIEDDEDETEDDIKDELMGAEKYLDMYVEKKDPELLVLAMDETNHAKKFILEARAKGENVDGYLKWHGGLLERIKMYKAV